MVKDTANLQKLLAPTVSALGYELLGCVYMPQQGHRGLLRIYIDSEKGITVTDCERVSRQVSAVLDVEDPIAGKYTLEVSSPGINRPLFTKDHFQRVVGSMVNVRLHIPLENRRQFNGKLLNVKDDKVIILIDDKEFVLPLANIAKANLAGT